MSIKAVTFDLWDTIVYDDSDEVKRTSQGLRSKAEQRRYLVWQALNAIAAIPREAVDLAYDVTDASFNMVWKENFISWTVEQRLRVLLNGLGRTLPESEFASLVQQTGRMEVDISPDPIDGIREALQTLSAKYLLCIVSDAIVTPGSGLRQILEKYDLKKYFSGFAFSDEVGNSKPHRAMFDSVCDQLGVSLGEIVHIGDRDHNDVKGPQALGAKAVLFTAARDADRNNTSADAICERPQDLPAIIDQLAGAGIQGG
jgi:putative hydrolase of the HAD superfamily